MKHFVFIVASVLMAGQCGFAQYEQRQTGTVVSTMVEISKYPNLVNALYKLFEQTETDSSDLREFLKKRVACEAVNLIPKELDLYAIPDPRTRVKSYVYSEFGYDLALPWGPPRRYRVATNKVGKITLGMGFENGVIVNLFDMTFQGEVHNFLSKDIVSAMFRLAKAEDLMESHRDLWHQAMLVSSSSLHETNSIQQVMRTGCLMIFKQSVWPFNTQHLYEFKTEHVSGFQFGTPENDAMVMIVLFDKSGRHATVLFRSNKKERKPLPLTQRDINNTILSFKMKMRPNKMNRRRP